MIYVAYERSSRGVETALQPLWLGLAAAHSQRAEAVPGVQEPILEPAAGARPGNREAGSTQ
jgi:hypothetical protein